MKKMVQYTVLLTVAVFIATASAQVPSSVRSREAIARVKPRLEQEMRAKGLAYGSQVFVRIFKESKELELWVKYQRRYRLFKTYRICTYGWGGLGPKESQGDGQAPEGFYGVTPKRMNPVSRFHLSFDLGYPNGYDRARKRTGSALMVHGSCVSVGCYAMTDPGIEEIYALVDGAFRSGQSYCAVHIFPFRMTDGNMKRHAGSKWIGFWENLKEGHDFFEKKGSPPQVLVKRQRYRFHWSDK